MKKQMMVGLLMAVGMAMVAEAKAANQMRRLNPTR